MIFKIDYKCKEFIGFEITDDNLGFIIGTYQIRERRICVSLADCRNHFKDFIQLAIQKFHTNKILIYNVLTDNWKLKGFEKLYIEDPMCHEHVLCYQGLWIIDDKENIYKS